MFEYNSFEFETQKQVDEFKRYENSKLSEWPKGAIKLAQENFNRYGFSGDILMSSLRDWIIQNI